MTCILDKVYLVFYGGYPAAGCESHVLLTIDIWQRSSIINDTCTLSQALRVPMMRL